MREIITRDSSVTFHNEKFDESYHCLAGAASEARIKFAEPCKIRELAKTGSVIILDICFGLGYNSAAAIDAVLESNPGCKIRIVGLENDSELFGVIQTLNPPFKSYRFIQDLNKNRLELNKNKIGIKIILDDALVSIKNLDEKFDAVFLDPFSPKKCPELWTEEFFRDIKSVMKPGAVLATYSCATHVRNKLREAGFEVKDGPVFGRKSAATIAIFK